MTSGRFSVTMRTRPSSVTVQYLYVAAIFLSIASPAAPSSYRVSPGPLREECTYDFRIDGNTSVSIYVALLVGTVNRAVPFPNSCRSLLLDYEVRLAERHRCRFMRLANLRPISTRRRQARV